MSSSNTFNAVSHTATEAGVSFEADQWRLIQAYHHSTQYQHLFLHDQLQDNASASHPPAASDIVYKVAIVPAAAAAAQGALDGDKDVMTNGPDAIYLRDFPGLTCQWLLANVCSKLETKEECDLCMGEECGGKDGYEAHNYNNNKNNMLCI